jgi:hypothetical protein
MSFVGSVQTCQGFVRLMCRDDPESIQNTLLFHPVTKLNPGWERNRLGPVLDVSVSAC